MTITTGKYIVAKDLHNSSRDILVTDIFVKQGGYIKAINYYAQPERRRKSFVLLKKIIGRIRQAEPGIQIILGGDFNIDLTTRVSKERNALRELQMKVAWNQVKTFHRTRFSSLLDFVVTDHNVQARHMLVTEAPSDHDMLTMELNGISPFAVKHHKQMVLSSIINDIKEEHVAPYLVYLLKLLNLAHKNNAWNARDLKNIRRELEEEIPLVVMNSPKNQYSVEKEIRKLIGEGAPFQVINTHLHRLRKYSYQSFIELNLLAQKTDPKNYHRALQNLIQWNVDLEKPAIRSCCDADPSTTYKTETGEVIYNQAARCESQNEWKLEFEPEEDSREQPEPPSRHDSELLLEFIPDQELFQAIKAVGKKSLSWDFITAWALKLMAVTKPKELIQVTKGVVDEWAPGSEFAARWYRTIRETENWIGEYARNRTYETESRSGQERDSRNRSLYLPAEVRYLLSENLKSTESLKMERTGMRLLKKLLAMELHNPQHMQARLLLMQCDRKMRKHKTSFPEKKVTRPIAVTGVLQKTFEKVLLQRIKGAINEVTSKYNAGFKRAQRTETLLLLIRMEIEKNLKEGKPTYILGFDVKGGYNNVDLEMLSEKFEELIIPAIARTNPSPSYLDATRTIFQHLISNPSMKIWKELEEFKMGKGVQQGGICSPLLFILLADKFAQITEAQNTPTRHSSTPYNWADDINSVTNDILALKNIIRQQRESSEKLKLPFSTAKTQLLAIYPKNWQYNKLKIGEKVLGIKVCKSLKILGLTWQQPRFAITGPQWFQKQAQTAVHTMKTIGTKSKRLRWHQNHLHASSQRTLMNSYAVSRVLYATPIWLPMVCKTKRFEIETRLRSIGRNIYGAQQ